MANSDIINNLKRAISQSPILTPIEQTEWLGLTDIMSNAQLLELEKILTKSLTGSKHSANISASPQSGNYSDKAAAMPKPDIQAKLKSSDQKNEKPSLPHLTQLPREVSKFPIKKNILSGPSNALVPSTSVNAIDSNSIKNLLIKSRLAPMPSLAPKKHLEDAERSAPKAASSSANPSSANAAESIIASGLNKINPAHGNSAKPPKTTSALPETLSVSARAPTELKTSASSASGQNNPYTQIRSGDFQSFQPSLPKNDFLSNAQSDKEIKLTSPRDIAMLSVEEMTKSGIENLPQNLAKIASEIGYYPLLKIFESSQLYQAYVQSGTSFLTGSRDLIPLLNRRQFEIIADTLIAIRTNQASN